MGVVVVDASILIGILGEADAHHERSRDAIRENLAKGNDLVIAGITYLEVLVGAIKHNPKNGRGIVDRFLAALPARIEPVTAETLAYGAEIRALHPKIKTPDALVIAIAREVRALHILTADRGWRVDFGVRVVVV